MSQQNSNLVKTTQYSDSLDPTKLNISNDVQKLELNT